MAAEVLCGRCGALLTNPTAPCPRCGSPASGRYAAAVARPRKSPRLAAVLAIVPGLGHFYLGHNLRGFGFLLGIGGFQMFELGLDVTVNCVCFEAALASSPRILASVVLDLSDADFNFMASAGFGVLR